MSAEKSSHLIEMIEIPIMISYRTICSERYHLTKGYVNKGNPEKQFKKLLTENILPPELL